MESLKISCITVCKNCKDELEKTLMSLHEQIYKNYEIIVIDGNSSDGTKELLEFYQQFFKKEGIKFFAVSEPDDGIYDAMNKGIKQANGEWVIFLNAGDLLVSENVFLNVFCEKKYEGIDALYGNYIIAFKDKKKYVKCSQLSDFKNRLPSSHQAFFTRTALMKKRPYNVKYKLVGDIEWYLYLYLEGGKFLYINEDISIFDGYGVSSYKRYQCYAECMEIRKEAGVKRDNFFVRGCKKLVWLVVGLLRKKWGIFYW